MLLILSHWQLGVGWVEERNPTPTISDFVGFHFVQPNPKVSVLV
ncbi:hypothetical protein [Nostoc sp. UHCC 0252]|nr:hypothetical protein [Nostoc sp. UHCC 0252]MEA5602803.1 hypothetical protein [Nostoc sp. UHCC 0252]